jgi:ribose transport system ATP-binding protein
LSTLVDRSTSRLLITNLESNTVSNIVPLTKAMMPMEDQHGPAVPVVPELALEVRGVRKSFAGVLVLRDASVHALVGHNGSGKSTLIKILAGFHAPDRDVAGACFGRVFPLGDHVAASRVGLRFVHQDLGLIDELGTVDNLALGPGFPVRSGGTIRWGEARRRSREIMASLGYQVDVTRPVGLLSASERTGVAIARALQSWSGDPAVVVLDEPTAAMPAPEVERLFGAIRRLREQGLGIVYVSHHLEEILALADDVTVLRNGRVAASRPVAGLTHGDLVTMVVGRDLAAAMHAAPAQPAAEQPAVLRVHDLETAGVHGVSFTVQTGEIVGLAGIAGSGREAVLPAIAGATGRRGAVHVNGNAVPPGRPRAAIRAGIGLVPADRRRAAVFPSFSATSNLTVSGVSRYARFGLLNHRAETADASRWLRDLGVTPPAAGAPILTLSGGNQQKIMVGRWLRCEPAVLALDEPTQGVDVGACQAVYASIRRAAGAGRGVLISSADSGELASLCHRVIVLIRGRVAAELAGPRLDAEQIDAISLGNLERV